MENCPKCGLPVADGAKFCAACGTRMPQKLIKSKVCSVCGNTLNAGAKFCNVCGTAVPQDETPADEPVVDERNPEMESIEVPELHFDDTPVQNQMNQMNGVTPGKGAGALVPIILIILILAVICVDVFWLFRDQIFGKKDESSNDCAVITLTDETDYPANEAFFFEELNIM